MVTVIVTIHGIGFQVPPKDDRGIRGYADSLHDHLSQALGSDVLGDDPGRAAGVRGPVYVHSHWPPGARRIEEGINRVGEWEKQPNGEPVRPGRVTTDKKLVNANQPIAHVALVYANLEERASALGPLGLITEMSIFRLGSYSNPFGLIGKLWQDWRSTRRGRDCAEPPSLQPRRVVQVAADSPDKQTIDIQPDPTGITATLRQLENDVAAYVTRDALRQRVRSFVTETLIRLACRPDVDGIIVNAHSQGTAVAYDVVRDFPVVKVDMIKALVTSGSPLRKYVELFAWGREVGCIYGIDNKNNAYKKWVNFWDERDPVADPLAARLGWHFGDPLDPRAGEEALFRAVDRDTGEVKQDFSIDDHHVDNLTNSCGRGLQAHNYWDNETEFVPPFVDVVKLAAGIV